MTEIEKFENQAIRLYNQEFTIVQQFVRRLLVGNAIKALTWTKNYQYMLQCANRINAIAPVHQAGQIHMTVEERLELMDDFVFSLELVIQEATEASK